MDERKIAAQWSRWYPGKKIVKLPERNPTEMICETEPASEPPAWSVAIAVIDQSAPHFHRKSVETYEVMEGELLLWVENKKILLKKGETNSILPNQVHWAKGKATSIKATSKPGWVPEDHILVKR